MNSIETIGLTKRFGSVLAVNDLNLKVNYGELFALLGVNGAGKTTTIKMLSCLLTPTSGDALLLGKSIVTQPYEVKKLINVSPQETAVARMLTVKENLELSARLYGSSTSEAKMLASEMINTFSLSEVETRAARKLSGGMQRRLSIAMALISKPKILFLDEPTLGLDVIARHELWTAIEKLKGSITIILTTHYMEEAQELSDRIGVMAHGSLVATGTSKELMTYAGADTFENAFVKLATEEVKK